MGIDYGYKQTGYEGVDRLILGLGIAGGVLICLLFIGLVLYLVLK